MLETDDEWEKSKDEIITASKGMCEFTLPAPSFSCKGGKEKRYTIPDSDDLKNSEDLLNKSRHS